MQCRLSTTTSNSEEFHVASSIMPPGLALGLQAEEDSDFAMFESTVAQETDIHHHSRDIDSLVAQELSSLSIQDLEKVYNDVHCISSEVPESPEQIQECLRQLENELEKITEKTAYDLARSMKSEFVENAKFRLQFLRADNMNPVRAAGRLVRHFQAKLELFGVSLLAKDITQDDLDDETLAALYDGTGQTLQVRDRAGRLILLSFVHPAHISVTAKLKRVFYGIMVNAEDVETQRKGCVIVSYLVGRTFSWSEFSHRRAWNAKLSSVLSNALPIRVDAFHFCHDSLVWKALFAVFQIASTLSQRVRTRAHNGTHSECLAYLQSFGIPTHVFPLSRDGTLLLDAHKETWTRRRAWERQRQQAALDNGDLGGGNRCTNIAILLDENSLRVDVPGREDVLLGRGPTFIPETFDSEI